MTTLTLSDPSDSLKMLRETLCVAQNGIWATVPDPSVAGTHSNRLDRIIAEIDRQRPLSADGTSLEEQLIEAMKRPVSQQITLESATPVVVTVPQEQMQLATDIIAQLQPHLRTTAGTLLVPDGALVGPYTSDEPVDLEKEKTDEEPEQTPLFTEAKPDPLVPRLPDPPKAEDPWGWSPDPAAEREAAVTAIAEGMDVPREVVTGEDAHGVYALGGWSAPASVFGFPEITVPRGGISFTSGPDFLGLVKPVSEMSKKELREEITRLHREHAKTRATLQKALRKERKKNRRLRRTITKVLGL